MGKPTPGPWVGFSDHGKCVAIMPAGRDGDICTFGTTPTAEDARLIMAAPSLLEYIQSSASAGCATAQHLLKRYDLL